jgi:DNA helicase-2/ATP-dependent DNA helicase PcrA
MIAETIALAKATGSTPQTLKESVPPRPQSERPDPQLVREAFRLYEDRKQERHLLDFDDILSRCSTALATDEQFAHGERFLIREIFVDEFQDVSASQVHLLRAYLGESDRITIVGDPRQSIYGFNGSDPHLMNEMRSEFAQMKVVHLTKNYRSTPEILTSAQSVLNQAFHGSSDARDTATRPPQPESRPHILACDNTTEEAAIALRYIKEQLYRGVAIRSIAALARTHQVLQPLRIALDRAAIPYRTSDNNPTQSNDDSQAALREILRLHAPRSLTELRDILESTIGEPATDADSAKLMHRLHESVARARREDSALSVAEFAELFEEGAFDAVAQRQGVTLSTFHRAKGLQWYHVHLLGVEDGLVPHSQARTGDALEEERRLLYVAMTRATNSLVITHARTRSFGTRVHQRRPSPFLQTLSFSESEESRKPESGSRSLERREEMAANSSTVLSLQRRRALEQWRLQAARAARVSPTSILHNRSLQALSTDDTLADESIIASRIESQNVRSVRHRNELLQLLLSLNRDREQLSP